MDASWDDLRTFVAALETGSFSAAAEALRVSQATVSRRIAALEEVVGHTLFDRTTSGLQATSAAALLEPYARSMASAARQASAALQGFEVAPEGLVRFATVPSIAADFLPPLLPVLVRRHPRLRVEILSDNLIRDVDRHEADVALRTVAPSSGDLLVRKVAEMTVGLFASRAYVASLPKRPRLSHLDLIGWSEDMAGLATARWIAAHAARPPAITSNSALTMRAAAAQGLGAVLASDLEGKVAGLERVPIRLDMPKVPIFLVVHRALRHVPRIAAFVEFVSDAVDATTRSDRWPPDMD